MTNHDGDEPSERVELVVPLDVRYGSLLRLVAAAVTADAGFSVDEIDDVRLGLSEVFALLADGNEGGRLLTTFHVDGRRLEIRLRPESDTIGIEPDELALAILRSVVDRFELGGDTIVLETMMHSHNQVLPGTTIDQIKKLRTDFPGRGPHTVTGPI